MNRLFLVISALSAFAHIPVWAMLTVGKVQPRPSKQYFTPQKIERDEQRASKDAQIFLNSYGQHSINKTGNMFCGLSTRAQKKVLPCLSHNQKLLVWCGVQGIEVPFLSAVLNGNKEVAVMYSQKPIGEILEAYASAKEMMKWRPAFRRDGKMGILQEQHYMALRNKESILLFEVDKGPGLLIYRSEVPLLMSSLKALDRVDPGIINIEKMTGQIKMYPLLSERASMFYSQIPNDSLKNIFALSLAISSLATPVGCALPYMVGLVDKMISFKALIEFSAKLSMPFLVLWFSGDLSIYVYGCYKNHLEYNILSNQPNLTDYLKKTAV